MKRIIAMFALLAAVLGAWAMTDEEQNRTVWNALDQILVEETGSTAYMYYYKQDMDGDGIDDLVIMNDTKAATPFIRAYSVGRKMAPIPMTRGMREKLERDPRSIQYIDMDWGQPADDITLKEPPIFISDMEKAKNKFIGWRDLGNYPAGNLYTHMVFKPHVNEIRFVRDNRIFSSLDGDTLWQKVREFKLKDPKVVAKMFRGYDDGLAVPVAVTRNFLTTHEPLQFSRWLTPEPKRTMDRSIQQIVIDHYGKQYRVKHSQWLATLPTQVGNRDYYLVLLVAPQKAIFGVVCIGEGTVASAVELCTDEKEGDATFSNDLSDMNMLEASNIQDLFDEHGPEIMCIMQTPVGLELYVRWSSMEGTHYSVWREVGTRMVNIIDEYHYWMFG